MALRCFLFLLQTVLIAGVTHSSLKSGVTLHSGDELISTLGYYKLVLIQKDCSLSLYQFNNTSQNYQSKNQFYSGINNGSCKSLTIANQNVVTDTNTTFLSLSSSTDLTQVRLIVDDQANLRLIGVKKNLFEAAPNAYFLQKKLSNFSQTTQHISILQQFQKITDKFKNQITNAKDWVFVLVNQSQLIIKHKSNNISQYFSIPTAFFSQSGIWNVDNQTVPYALFDGIKYSVTCGGKKSELLGPFIMVIDNYWPVLRIYDQEGYIVFEYSFNINSQFYKPCPKETFSFQGDCLLDCPKSYFKSIEDDRGSCKLNCEQGSIYDPTQRTCVCKNRQISAKEQFFCINSSKYYFGCFCENSTYFTKSTWKCAKNCTQGMLAIKGICLSCGNNCLNCSNQAAYPFFIVCNYCKNGYVLSNGVCLESNSNCSLNCLLCIDGSCIACLPFYSLLNNTCIQQCPSDKSLNVLSNLTSFCSSQNSNNNCPPSCHICQSGNCLVCKPQYTLLLSSLTPSCQKQNLLFGCSSSSYTNFKDLVCYNNQPAIIDTLKKCESIIKNCLLCIYQSSDTCIVCKDGYFVQQNQCVSNCTQGYYNVNQACVKAMPKCKVHGFIIRTFNSSLDLNIVSRNKMYGFLTGNGKQQLNQPYGYQLFTTKNYQLSNNNYPKNSILHSSQVACFQCQNGFGLSQDKTSCLDCPTGCLLCLYADDNSSCIADNIADLTLFTTGINIKNCQTFLSDNLSCISSCPQNTYPTMSSVYQQMKCQADRTNETTYLKIDGTTIQVSSDQYLHRFVFNNPLSQQPALKARLLQSQGTIDNSLNSYIVNSNKSYHVLNLSGAIQTYKSVKNYYPANSVYGINSETSYLTYIKHSLAYIGYILSIAVLMTQCVYVGNGLTYKMDNFIILTQSIFYFLFTDVFISNPVSQYYYGWSWMHLKFFPNFFWSLLSADEKTIPPYALYNVDANFIRNAGCSISLLLTFAITWLIVSVVCYYVEVKLGKWQIWYVRICKNSLTGTVELLSFNIFYWAVAYFRYDYNSDSKTDSKQTYTGIPVLFIIAIVGYTLIRIYLDILVPLWKRTNYYNQSAIYMIKRIVYASVIACSYQHKAYLVIILLFQLAFAACRYFLLQKPTNIKQKLVIVIEQLAIVFGLVILFLIKNAFAVAFLITLIVYLWFLTFVIDLVDLYLISKNKVLQNTWAPCLQQKVAINSKESSKQGSYQQKTDRPFNSQVQK